MTATVIEHAPWCVLTHTSGSCSDKRGKWDRTTNTWDTQLTTENRRMIKRALIRYRRYGESREEVIAWVKSHPGFENSTVDTLQTWYMTYRRMRKRGKRWPI